MGRAMELHGRLPSCLGTRVPQVLTVPRERDTWILITALYLGSIVSSPSSDLIHGKTSAHQTGEAGLA